MNKEQNSYYNEQLDFYIEKPGSWDFLPTQWAMNIRKKTQLSNLEMKELLARANEPLVYMLKTLECNDIAYPTAQVTCRPIKNPSADERKWFLENLIALHRKSFKDYDLIDSSAIEEVSGFPATYFNASFSMKNEDGVDFQCLSSCWAVFYYDIALTVGLSGSVVNPEEYIQDHRYILDSILLGTRND